MIDHQGVNDFGGDHDVLLFGFLVNKAHKKLAKDREDCSPNPTFYGEHY